MKKLKSATKRRLNTLALVCIFAIGALLNLSTVAFATTPELTYSQIGQQVPVNTSSFEVPPSGASINTPVSETPSTNIQPMDNPNSVAGGTFGVALAPYASANCTLGETYSQTSSAYAFQAISGVPNADLLQMFKSIDMENCSFADMLGLSLNQWSAKLKQYSEPASPKSKKQPDDYDENVLESILNLTVEIVVSTIKTGDSDVSAVFDVFDGVTATDILTSSVGMSTLCAAASAASGIADSGNEPISNLIVKSADIWGPKENGEKYTSPLDLLIYQMKVQEGLNITEDTPVRDFLKLIITADGPFVIDETNSDRYASIFYINGAVDPQAVFQLPFRAFSVEDMNEEFLAEFDGELLDSTQISITEREVELDGYTDTETVVTISGLFDEPGYHSMQMSLAGWPFFVYIELSPAIVPVTGVELSPTAAELYVGDLLSLNATVAPAAASNKSLRFTSDNYSVADVNQNGVITAKAPGTATITVTTADGGFTAVCTVTLTEGSNLFSCLKRIIAFFRNACCCERIIECLVSIITRLLSFIGC